MLGIWFYFWDSSSWGPTPPVSARSRGSRYRRGYRLNWISR